MESYLYRCSLLSVGALIVGHAKRDPALRNRGIELYSHAIRLLSRALGPTQLAKRGSIFFDLTMAGYILAIYEVSSGESAEVDSLIWPHHATGCIGRSTYGAVMAFGTLKSFPLDAGY
jgi:hypothetical protein